MFKRGWLRRGVIYGDEGYSVSILDRSAVVYQEGKKKMIVGGELLANGFIVYLAGIGPWDEGEPVEDADKGRIADRIKRALESQGMSVHIEQA